MRVAIIGTGVSGLVCARLLHRDHDVVVYEADDHVGGHVHTVRVDLADETHEVDTGFIVYNERNYPRFTELLADLDVATRPTDMSFSISDERSGLEWAGSSPDTVFAQRANLLRPGFHRMLVDAVRFHRRARRLLADPDPTLTLDDLLAAGRYSSAFVEQYLVPLGAAIWSADPTTFGRFPAVSLARFLDNHGLLGFGDRPRWRTVVGGSARYVEALVRPFAHRIRTATPVDKVVRRDDGVELLAAGAEPEVFDRVVVATHSDQALRLLADPTPAEREVLGALRYQPNVATLHTDARLLPRNRRARASWNYHVLARPSDRATVTYHMNRLQGLESRHELCVTLNRDDVIDPDRVVARSEVSHPVLDHAALAAQRRRAEIDGPRRTRYVGAYWGYGFHEDGVRSALDVCADLGAPWPGTRAGVRP